MPMQKNASPRMMRHVEVTLRRRAVAQDQWRGLPVGDPVGGDRRAGSEQFLE